MNDVERAATGLAATLIGVNEASARGRIQRFGYLVRVVPRDGEDFAIRADRHSNRINLAVEGGVVTSAEVF